MNSGVETENGKKFLKLKVVGQDGADIYFRVKRTIKLGKLMNAYSERTGTPKAAYRFLFDGKRIMDKQTPEELEMEEDDVIEAFVEQKGGFQA